MYTRLQDETILEHAHLLRNLCPSIVTTLCDIVNWSTESGVFPSSWKKAKLFLSIKVAQIMREIIIDPFLYYQQPLKFWSDMFITIIYNYLVTNGLLCDSQSGFRKKKHSCNTCLTNICEICYENINNGHNYCWSNCP